VTTIPLSWPPLRHADHLLLPFLCRIRNADMTPCEGVTIQDMGHKIGCNGVDNGQLVFNHYVAPRCVYIPTLVRTLLAWLLFEGGVCLLC
jgi:hypothetical protein